MATRVVIDAADLFTHRVDKVGHLLSDFADENIVVEKVTALSAVRISAANEFTRHLPAAERRFSVLSGLVYGKYYEEWLPIRNGRLYSLRRAYMNAYLITDIVEQEFAALHCDLDDGDMYKRGPHVHLWIVGEPINHAHLALNVGHLAQVTSSVVHITKALRIGMAMLRKEVVQRYCDHLLDSI